MIVNLTLAVMAFSDMRTREVANFLQLLLFFEILIMYNVDVYNLLFAIALFLLYIVYEQTSEVKIGGADIKIICSLLLINVQMVLYIIFIASLFAIMYGKLNHKRIIPFVPFLWLGYTIVNF